MNADKDLTRTEDTVTAFARPIRHAGSEVLHRETGRTRGWVIATLLAVVVAAVALKWPSEDPGAGGLNRTVPTAHVPSGDGELSGPDIATSPQFRVTGP